MVARSFTSRIVIVIAAFVTAVPLFPQPSLAAGLINTGTIIAAGGTLEVAPLIDNQGTIEGVGTIDAAVSHNGIISPGSQFVTATGTLTINGDLSMAGSGTLQMGITGIDQYDQLVVIGTAALGGTLDVSLGGNFTLTSGCGHGQHGAGSGDPFETRTCLQ